jgi:precorrin-2 dehydrogenase / sirohydrochlorin ferrochelatase
VVVVGAGPVAAAKLRSLRASGARITVIAPEAVAPVHDLVESGAITWEQRTYRPGDLTGALLVVAATASAAVNDAVAADAARQGTVCVRSDVPAGAAGAPSAVAGSAAFMGAVRRGPLTIAVASGVPALSRRLRTELADTYDEAYGDLAALLAQLRTDPQVQALLDPHDDATRAARWRLLLDTDILDHIRTGRIDLAKEVALACLSSSTG